MICRRRLDSPIWQGGDCLFATFDHTIRCHFSPGPAAGCDRRHDRDAAVSRAACLATNSRPIVDFNDARLPGPRPWRLGIVSVFRMRWLHPERAANSMGQCPVRASGRYVRGASSCRLVSSGRTSRVSRSKQCSRAGDDQARHLAHDAACSASLRHYRAWKRFHASNLLVAMPGGGYERDATWLCSSSAERSGPRNIESRRIATGVRRIATVLNGAMQGKINVVLPVTLRVSAATTVIIDARISAFSALLFSPLTLHAAAEVPTLYVTNQISGQATLNHSNNGLDDRSYNMAIIG